MACFFFSSSSAPCVTRHRGVYRCLLRRTERVSSLAPLAPLAPLAGRTAGSMRLKSHERGRWSRFKLRLLHIGLGRFITTSLKSSSSLQTAYVLSALYPTAINVMHVVLKLTKVVVQGC